MAYKKVLLLTQLFPPHSGVGALRMFFFARYLSEYGFTPTVVTGGNISGISALDATLETILDGIKIYRIDAPGLDSSKHYIAKILRYPDRFIAPELFGFRCFSLKFQKKLHSLSDSIRPVAIVASSPPEAMLAIGQNVSRRLLVPLIADIRDIPEQWETSKRLDNRLMYRLMRRRHTRFLKRSDAIVTVSGGLEMLIKKRLGPTGNPTIHVIPNGVDAPIIQSVAAKQYAPGRLNIVYTGQVYYQDHIGLHIFFQSLKRAIKKKLLKKQDVRVIFAGTEPSILNPLISKYALADIVEIVSRLPYLDAIALQKGAHLKLHLSHSKTRGILTTKIFEYMACGGVVISVPFSDEIDSIFKRFRKNSILCTSSVDQLSDFIGQTCKNFRAANPEGLKSNDLYFTHLNIPKEITRAYQTQMLAGVLDSAVREYRLPPDD